MLSGQTSPEALHSAAYVQHYLDWVENMPDDLQRHLTRMRELDVTYRACLRELDKHVLACTLSGDTARRSRALSRVQCSLITAQEIGDEKLQLLQLAQDLVDNRSRQLDHDYRTLVSCMEVSTNGAPTEEAAAPVVEPPPVRDKEPTPAPPTPAPVRNASPPAPQTSEREKEKNDRDKTGERWSKRARRSRTTTGNNAGAHTDGDSGERENTERGAHNNTSHKKGIGKKKKRKARASAAAARAETPPEEADAIDPDEPRYCLCDQISFGEMILCDNDLCPIEWFHFSCVSLSTKPKGKWFCPKCRGDRPNVMKPKGQFLKELERYNKEKEEKA